MPPFPSTLRQEISTVARNESETRLIVLMVVFTVLTLVTIAFRIASKLMQWGRLAWDDLLLLASTFQMLAANILFVVAIKRGGFGRHISEVTDEQLVFFKKSYFVAGLIMPTCYATAKLSMLWLLHSIFSFRSFQRVVKVLAIVVMCWWVAAMLLDTFICFPVYARWDATITGACSNKVVQVEYFATPIPWIITDFAILIAPLPVLATMKIPRARQCALIALFGIGIATCAVACKRYITLLNIDDDDLTYGMVEPCIWTMIESSTTIVCAALPASMHALRRVLPTQHITLVIQHLEERLDALKSRTTQRRNWGNAHFDQEVADSPPANLSTRRLELTPI